MIPVSLDTRILAAFVTLYATATLCSMAGMEIFGWSTAVGVLLMMIFKRRSVAFVRNFVWLPVDVALLALFGIVILGAVFKTPEGISKVDVIGSARWVLLFMFLRAALAFTWSDEFSKKVVIFLTGFIAIVSVYSVWQYFYGIDLIRGARHVLTPSDYRNGQPIYRAEGLFGSSMTFGNSIVMSWCFPVAWVLYGKRSTWVYKLAVFTAVAGLLAMIATMTRGVWLAAVAALIVMNLKSIRRGAILLVAMIAIFAAISSTMFPELSSRLKSIGDSTHASNLARVHLWRANLEIFKENPLLGVGYGVNEDIVGNYYARLGITDGFLGHAHNTYLQFLSGTGILGFLCFAFFTVYFLWITWNLSRDMARPSETAADATWPRIFVEGALGAQVALIVGGLTECNFKDAEVNHQFLFILAVLATIYVRHTRKIATV